MKPPVLKTLAQGLAVQASQANAHSYRRLSATAIARLVSLGVGLSLLGAMGAIAQPSLIKTPGVANSSVQVAQNLMPGPPVVDQLPGNLAKAMRQALTGKTANPGKVQVVESSRKTWRNTCLELAKPTEKCAQRQVPGWRLVLSNGPQTWVYRTDTAGKVIRLESQSGTATALPATVSKAVLQDASEAWGLPANTGRIVKAESTNWAYGCERSTFPHPCDQILVKGWRVVVESNTQRWIYHTNQNGSLVHLHTRELINGAKAPASVTDAVLNLAAEHLELPKSQLLITQVQQQTWTNSCLELPSPVERCAGTSTPGWRITVEGKPGQVQVYRTDNSGNQIRTEAIANLPARSDRLPNSIAQLLLKNASARLRVPTTQLYILQAERQRWSNYCFDLPNAQATCAQAMIVGWRVTIDGAGQSIVYRVDHAGSQVKHEYISKATPQPTS